MFFVVQADNHLHAVEVPNELFIHNNPVLKEQFKVQTIRELRKQFPGIKWIYELGFFETVTIHERGK